MVGKVQMEQDNRIFGFLFYEFFMDGEFRLVAMFERG